MEAAELGREVLMAVDHTDGDPQHQSQASVRSSTVQLFCLIARSNWTEAFSCGRDGHHCRLWSTSQSSLCPRQVPAASEVQLLSTQRSTDSHSHDRRFKLYSDLISMNSSSTCCFPWWMHVRLFSFVSQSDCRVEISNDSIEILFSLSRMLVY